VLKTIKASKSKQHNKIHCWSYYTHTHTDQNQFYKFSGFKSGSWSNVKIFL